MPSPSLVVVGAACLPEVWLPPAGSPAAGFSASLASETWCTHPQTAQPPLLQEWCCSLLCTLLGAHASLSTASTICCLRVPPENRHKHTLCALHSTACNPTAALQFGNGEERRRVKWYRNRKFWFVVFSVLVTEALLVAAIIMVVRHNNSKIVYFETWRWLFFISGESLPSAVGLGLRSCRRELPASMPCQGAAQRVWRPGGPSLHSLSDMSHSLCRVSMLLPAANQLGARLFSHACLWDMCTQPSCTVAGPQSHSLHACLCVGFFPIYWISRAVIHLLVLMVETTAFTTKKAVYYTIGTRVSSAVAAAGTRGGHAAPAAVACLLLVPQSWLALACLAGSKAVVLCWPGVRTLCAAVSGICCVGAALEQHPPHQGS